MSWVVSGGVGSFVGDFVGKEVGDLVSDVVGYQARASISLLAVGAAVVGLFVVLDSSFASSNRSAASTDGHGTSITGALVGILVSGPGAYLSSTSAALSSSIDAKAAIKSVIIVVAVETGERVGRLKGQAVGQDVSICV